MRLFPPASSLYQFSLVYLVSKCQIFPLKAVSKPWNSRKVFHLLTFYGSFNHFVWYSAADVVCMVITDMDQLTLGLMVHLTGFQLFYIVFNLKTVCHFYNTATI